MDSRTPHKQYRTELKANQESPGTRRAARLLSVRVSLLSFIVVQAAVGQPVAPTITNVADAASARGPISTSDSVALAPGREGIVFGRNLAETTASAAAPGQPLLGGIEVHFVADSCFTADCELVANLTYVSPTYLGFVVPNISDITRVWKTRVVVIKAGQRFDRLPSPVSVLLNAVSLESSPSPALYDQPVTFTAHVSAVRGYAGSLFYLNVGAVTFMDGDTPLGVVSLSNVITFVDTPPVRRYDVSFTTSKLTPGNHSIRADYSGDYSNSPMSSGVIVQKVGVPEVTIWSDPNPSLFGQTVTIVATISPATCTGTVTFFDPVNNLGSSTVDKGRALLQTAALSVGNHPFTVTYSGDSRCAPLLYGPANDFYYRTTSQTVTPH